MQFDKSALFSKNVTVLVRAIPNGYQLCIEFTAKDVQNFKHNILCAWIQKNGYYLL